MHTFHFHVLFGGTIFTFPNNVNSYTYVLSGVELKIATFAKLYEAGVVGGQMGVRGTFYSANDRFYFTPPYFVGCAPCLIRISIVSSRIHMLTKRMNFYSAFSEIDSLMKGVFLQLDIISALREPNGCAAHQSFVLNRNDYV